MEQRVCSACEEMRLKGVHGEIYGGRFSWAVEGTVYCGERDVTSAHEEINCLGCDFLNLVDEEEADNFLFGLSVLRGFLNNC